MLPKLTKDQRAALVQSLHALPSSMRTKPQWLMWSYVEKRGATKPAKMPYYANGHLRGWPNGKPRGGEATEAQPNVEQGHALDRAALVTFEQALEHLVASGRYDGVGFAFLPGDGLIGVDIDGAITEDGEISSRCQLVMRMCPSYTERSVSGRGVHIILAGELAEKFKSDAIGLEVYAGSQFFTCTGAHWTGTSAEAEPADVEALSIMRGMCAQANEQARLEREQKRAAELAASPSAPSAKPRASRAAGAAAPGGDFKLVNERALERLDAWVPSLFPDAKPYQTVHGRGYRVSSKALKRNLQEDLSITPGGIQDWGEEEGKSAIDLVVQWGGKTPHEALLWLADRLGLQLSSKPPAAGPGRAPRRREPPSEGEAPPGADDRPEPPPSPSAEKAPAPRAGKGGGDRESKIRPEALERLFRDFRYQYGSDQAWDVLRREPITISNLRHTFGSDTVKFWMNSPERRVIFAEDVLFEPGVKLPEHQLNLFAGLPVEPEEGDCSVMVELLKYLCSTSEAPGMGPEDIADWALRWCALPLQQVGAKMATALVFHGPMGTGKNLFFDVLRDLYGEYGVMVGQTELEDKYNTWLSGKMLIVGDEVVSKQEMYHAKNRLKWIITQETKIPIRAMHQDTRWESNHANLVFLSNEAQPLALEDGDRRMLVVYTPVADDGGLYARVREFLDAGGARKFLHFLQNMDLQDFTRHTKPPLTRAKATLIELGYKPAERFMHEWLQGFLPLPMRVCSTEQLYKAFRRWCDSTGERYPPKQAEFTLQSSRFAGERIERDDSGARKPPPFAIKVVQVPDEQAKTGRKSYRIWLPRGCGQRDQPPPPEGEKVQTEGQWARECIDEFEKVIRSFLRSPRLEGDEGFDD